MTLKLYILLQVVVLIVFFELSQQVSECPDKCKCTKREKGDQWIDCSKNRLSFFPSPSQWPEETYGLDISVNRLRSIDVLETHEHLQHLDVSDNLIDEVSSFAFGNVKNLVFLDLSSNQIEDLEEDTFKNLQHLEVLNISKNKLKELKEDTFNSLPHLRELRIGGNPLVIIHPVLFRQTKEIKVLDLSNIQAYMLVEALFHPLYHLEELDLSDNEFTSVPTNAIRTARLIKVLKLNGNPIKELDEHSFTKLLTLEELYLNKMPNLVEIKEKTFCHLIHLKKLSIAFNHKLSYIDKNAFLIHETYNRSNFNLDELILRGNLLSQLYSHSLPFCNLTTLDVRENPWNCDCNLGWLKMCQLRDELSAGIICAHPATVRDLEFSKIDASDLICEYDDIYREGKMMRMFVIVFAFLVLSFFALTFILFTKRERFAQWWDDKKRGTGAIYYVKTQSNSFDPEI